MNAEPPHLEAELLTKFLLGDLEFAAIDAVEQHLETCSECRGRLRQVSPADPLLDRIRDAARELPPDGAQVEPSRTAVPGRHDAPQHPPPLSLARAEATRTPLLDSTKLVGGPPHDLSGEAVRFEPPAIPGYQLVRQLGRGGMGVVYLARQIGLNRLVAVKMLVAGRHASPEQLTRFRIEAQTLASLQHPHIVDVYDIGVVDNLPYLAIEYVEGGSLAEAAQQRRFEPPEAAELVRRLALAIQAAHDRGIIHRDLKPANVLLAGDARTAGTAEPSGGTGRPPPFPKVSDFGLARWSQAELQLTQTGAIAGSPQYMAPEQARGELDLLGPAVDVYSLGAVLYELLSGQAPFQGLSVLGILQAVLHDEPVPPRQWQADVPRDLETICLKCLEKEPARRYATARQLAEDLQRFLRHEPILARPLGRLERLGRWRRRNPIIAALLALTFCALALVGAVSTAAAVLLYRAARESAALAQAEHAARRNAEDAQQRAQTAERVSVARLVSGDLLVGNVSWRDKESVNSLLWYLRAWRNDTLATRGEDQHRLRLAVQMTRYPQLVGLCLSDKQPQDAAWTTGFQRVAWRLDDGSAELWDPFRGERLAVWRPGAAVDLIACDAAGGRFATFSADRTVRLWRADDGAAAGEAWTHPADVRCAAFRSDGQVLATGGADGRIRCWSPATGQAVSTEIDCGAPVSTLEFRPAGKSLLSIADDGRLRLWDPATGQPLGDALSEAASAKSSSAESPLSTGPRFASDGGCFVTVAGKQLQLRSAERGELVQQWTYPAAVRAWSLNDSASRVAVLRDDRRVSVDFREDPGESRQTDILAVYPAHNVSLSGDGRILATMMGHARLFFWHPQAALPVSVAFRPLAATRKLAFSGDGRTIMALSLDGALRIWQLPDPDDKVEPYLSTDAGIAELERRAGIAETSADGHAPPAAAGDSPPARLSRDGRRKLTVTADGDVQVWNTTTGAAIGPPLQHAREIVAADLSRDGRRIAIGLVNRSLKLYDADTGDPLGASIPLSVTPSPRGLWFADDDRSLLLRSRDGGWHQYRLPQLDLPQDQVGLLLNLLTGEQIDEGTQRILMLPRDTFQQAPTSYLQIWRRWRGLD